MNCAQVGGAGAGTLVGRAGAGSGWSLHGNITGGWSLEGRLLGGA